MLGARAVHVLDDQVHVHHGLLPLIGLLGDLLHALLFGLGFADDDPALDLFCKLFEVFKSFLRILPIDEAYEAEAS